jgi:valyl-tRNA synthetase
LLRMTNPLLVHVLAKTPEMYQLLKSEQQTLQTLVGKGVKTLEIHNGSEVIPGCALQTVSEDVYVLLLVKGVVDFDAEIKKLEDKKSKTSKNMEQLKAKTLKPDYAKVPDDVKDANDAKFKQFDAEIDVISKAMAQFLRLKNE